MPILIRLFVVAIGAACVWKAADSLGEATRRASEVARTTYTPFHVLSVALFILARGLRRRSLPPQTMKTPLIALWVLVALGLGAVIQFVGPYVVGGLLAFALFRVLHR